MKDEVISLKQYEDDKEFQEWINSHMSRHKELASYHATNIYISTHGGIDPKAPHFLELDDPNYKAPTKEQVGEVVKLLHAKGLTNTDISKKLGISTNKNRTLLYWLAESRDDRNIPGAAWRLLTQLAGITLTTGIIPDDVRERLYKKADRPLRCEQPPKKETE